MKNAKIHIALFLVNLIYAGNYSIAKMVMPEFLPAFGFILIRVVGALLLFGAFQLIFIKEKIEKTDFPRLILCGLFGVAINQLCFFKGLSYTVPVNASIIMISTPILVLLMSALIIRERLSAKKIIGVALGFVGAFIILAKGGFSISNKTMIGDLLILVNASSYALYLVIAKPLMKKYHPLTVIKWVFTFGLIPVLIAGGPELMAVDWQLSTKIWSCIAYVVICTTFLAYVLNIFALKAVNPTVVAAYMYLQPVLAAVIAWQLRGDSVSALQLAAGFVTGLGVFLVIFDFGKQMKVTKS